MGDNDKTPPRDRAGKRHHTWSSRMNDLAVDRCQVDPTMTRAVTREWGSEWPDHSNWLSKRCLVGQ
jgi:hypothetical protein